MATALRPATIGAALLMAAASLSPTRAAAETARSAALRRACASGALTAYACAQRGQKAPDAVEAPPPAAPLQAQPLPETAAAPIVEPRRGRRGRGVAEAPGVATRPYQDAQGRYRIDIPAGWELRIQADHPSLWNGDDWIELRVLPAAAPQAAAAAALDLMRKTYRRIDITTRAPTQVGARAGQRLTADAVTAAGRKARLVSVAAALDGGRQFVLLAGAPLESASVLEDGVAAVLATMHLK